MPTSSVLSWPLQMGSPMSETWVLRRPEKVLGCICYAEAALYEHSVASLVMTCNALIAQHARDALMEAFFAQMSFSKPFFGAFSGSLE